MPFPNPLLLATIEAAHRRDYPRVVEKTPTSFTVDFGPGPQDQTERLRDIAEVFLLGCPPEVEPCPCTTCEPHTRPIIQTCMHCIGNNHFEPDWHQKAGARGKPFDPVVRLVDSDYVDMQRRREQSAAAATDGTPSTWDLPSTTTGSVAALAQRNLAAGIVDPLDRDRGGYRVPERLKDRTLQHIVQCYLCTRHYWSGDQHTCGPFDASDT